MSLALAGLFQSKAAILGALLIVIPALWIGVCDKQFVQESSPEWVIGFSEFFISTGWFLAAIGAGLIVFRWIGSPVAMLIAICVVGLLFWVWGGLP